MKASAIAIPAAVGLVGLVLGYFGGREHLKYEIRQTALSAAQMLSQGFSEGLASSFGGATETPAPEILSRTSEEICQLAAETYDEGERKRGERGRANVGGCEAALVGDAGVWRITLPLLDQSGGEATGRLKQAVAVSTVESLVECSVRYGDSPARIAEMEQSRSFSYPQPIEEEDWQTLFVSMIPGCSEADESGALARAMFPEEYEE
jgi:hypothetical protein